MKKKRGFTLIELLVVIAIIAMLLAILMPALSKVKKIAMRVICGTNLKGLGTSQTVYANENKDNWAVVNFNPGSATWRFDLAVEGWQTPAISMARGNTGITVGASLYMLVRNADVGLKSFVCPASDQKEFDGKNTNNLDIVQLWDFGSPVTNATLTKEMGPKNCVSYAYHQPYGTTGRKSKNAVDGTRGSSFAAMADKNPWFDSKITGYSGFASTAIDPSWQEKVRQIGNYYLDSANHSPSGPTVRAANAYPHSREGQNVVYADGHSAYMNVSDVGVKNDNIYTYWVYPVPTTSPASDHALRQGVFPAAPVAPTGYSLTTLQPQGNDDSYLVNDDTRSG